MSSTSKKRIRFVAHDTRLREEVDTGLGPHFADGEKPLWVSSELIIKGGDLLVVCVSGLRDDVAMLTIQAAHQVRQAVGLIVRTEDREKWMRLSSLHSRVGFRFVVAIGGPREHFRRYFPKVSIISDMTELAAPGKIIADFIRRAADRVRQENAEERQSLGPIPRPYAS